MVLQNKYKARASRRYKAAHGIPAKPKAGNAPEEKTEESNSGANNSVVESAEGEERVSHDPLKTNTWRYEQSDTEEEAEPEPDVDITKLQEKVLALDIDARMQGQVPGSESDESDDELADPSSRKAQLEILKNVDWEGIQREKQDSEAARELKERFQRQAQGGYTAASWRRVNGSQVSLSQKSRKHRAPDNVMPPQVSAAEKIHSTQGTQTSCLLRP
ncbi:hypothetical protein MCAP1_001593 [Malassezia caprae]|uniref:Uncharacterized protein n=1 Tax=Malassezia caprae TaxID=1381934 RepID=A0AAF0E5M0_9BASI|nr:hypothetical protein MCAP1_001593 [Malassezia caprae]